MGTPLNNSVLKGFEILSLFSANTREISAAMVSDHLDMNHATAHRFLMTLEHAGALRSTRRGFFSLGPKIDQLAHVAEETGALASVIAPEIEVLSHELNESVMACRLTRHGPTCVAVAKSARTISVDINVGTLLPPLASAQGKLWLAEMSPTERGERLAALTAAGAQANVPDFADLDAELRQIRQQNYALNLGDNEPDIAAVSVPVRGPDGKLVLTLSVFGMLSRFSPEFRERALLRLAQCAERVSRKL